MYNDQMNAAESILPNRWTKILCILAGLYAMIVSTYLFVETAKPSGSRDFHPFWYAGHFIHQGRDPYAAYLTGEQLRLPIRYLDGVTIDQNVVLNENLSLIPTNTPIMLLFLSLFSYFSWDVAKWMFLFFNLILMFTTGWLVLWRIPFAGVKLARLDEVLIFLLYFDFSATRIAIENGQTTLLVFFMMLLALLYAKRSWPLAALALGLALSKYSLSLPLFLFFLYRKNFKVLLLAIAIQGLGLLGLAAITQSSPMMIVRENVLMFAEVFGQPGVHLSHFFEHFVDNRIVRQIPVLIMTLLVFIPPMLWLRRRIAATSAIEEVIDFHVITVLFIWTLLVGYHRLYDTLILIVFVVLVFKGLASPDIWRLTNKRRMALLSFMAILPLVLVLPARIVGRVWPRYYGTVSDGVTTVFLLIILSISMLLLRRFVHILQTQTLLQRSESHDIQIDPHRNTQSVRADHS